MADARGVYGFDIAVEEGGMAVSRQVWRGVGKNADDDTGGFGRIVRGETRP